MYEEILFLPFPVNFVKQEFKIVNRKSFHCLSTLSLQFIQYKRGRIVVEIFSKWCKVMIVIPHKPEDRPEFVKVVLQRSAEKKEACIWRDKEVHIRE